MTPSTLPLAGMVQASTPSPDGLPPGDGASPKKKRTRRKKRSAPATIECSFADYQAVEGVNWSTLKHLVKSPLHYKFHVEQPPEGTAAMMAGRVLHSLVLEPDRFPLEYAVFTGPRRAGADWAAFEEAHRGRTIIKESEYEEAIRIRDAVRGHKVADRLLSGGKPERTITWTDEATGIKCKGRLDYVKPDGFVDLKRTVDIEEHHFAVTAHRLLYHMQLAWYARGLKALGMAEPEVWMVAVEGSAPYDVAPMWVDPGVIATGDDEIGKLLGLLADCQKRKKWPGRYPETTTFLLPGYAYVEPDAEGADDLGLNVPEASNA